MIRIVSLESTSIEMLGPIFYADDYALVSGNIAQQVDHTLDLFQLTENPFPEKPWRDHKYPLHSCYHRHIDGSIVLTGGGGDDNIAEVVSNASAQADWATVLVKLKGKPLAVPLTTPIDATWNGGRCLLIQLVCNEGPVYYATQLIWVNSTGTDDTNGRANYRSYSYDTDEFVLREGPAGLISRSISRTDFRLLAREVTAAPFAGVVYGGVGTTWYAQVDPPEEADINEFLGSLSLGIAGHYPMARDTDRALEDKLLGRIIPDKVNLPEYVIGLRDLPNLAKSGLEVVSKVRHRYAQRVLAAQFPGLKWPKEPKPPKKPLTRRQYMDRLLDLNAGRIDDYVQRQIEASLGDLELTVRELGGMYLGGLYGLLPVPGDSLAVSEIAQAIARARSEFTVDLRTRQTFCSEGWLGYQALQVNLAQAVLEELPDIDTILDANRPLRVGAGLGFQNGDTLLEDAQRRLAAIGLPATPADIALTLWELFPYSFVADWFVGISDKLESMSKDQIWGALPVDFSCRTVKAEKNISDTVTEIAANHSLTVLADVLAFSYDRHYAATITPQGFEGGNPTYGQHWVEGSLLGFLRTRKRSTF